jgi:hypothetical protein
MKFLSKRTVLKFFNIAMFSLLLFSCKDNQTIETQPQQNIEETPEILFAKKTFEIFEILTNEDIPPQDLKFVISKDENGFLKARFSLIGESLEQIKFGSFVKKDFPKTDGTTCDSKWKCGKAIYKCLQNGDDALISAGACAQLTKSYCVTCVTIQ